MKKIHKMVKKVKRIIRIYRYLLLAKQTALERVKHLQAGLLDRAKLQSKVPL